MLYHICHKTFYSFSHSVLLKPHIIRLRPHSSSWQTLHEFSWQISPQPESLSEYIDLDGNHPIKVWFTQPTESLEIQVISKIETLQPNPFIFLLEPWALALPFDYPMSLLSQLEGYLKPYSYSADPIADRLAQELLCETDGETLSFLSTLNQRIYESCDYIHRETGHPWMPGITWQKKQGSCRDLCVLFMEVCRTVGLAARFVSGYQEGDPDSTDRHLHAWVEVYLPGAGWRGYDPTLGLAVSDRHIAVAASAIPQYTAPVRGTFTPVNLADLTFPTPIATLQTDVLLTHLND